MAEAPRYGQIDQEYAAQLTTTSVDDDGPIWMVNLMKYRDRSCGGINTQRGRHFP